MLFYVLNCGALAFLSIACIYDSPRLPVISANSRMYSASRLCSVTVVSVTTQVIHIAQLQPVILLGNDTGRGFGTLSLESFTWEKPGLKGGRLAEAHCACSWACLGEDDLCQLGRGI